MDEIHQTIVLILMRDGPSSGQEILTSVDDLLSGPATRSMVYDRISDLVSQEILEGLPSGSSKIYLLEQDSGYQSVLSDPECETVRVLRDEVSDSDLPSQIGPSYRLRVLQSRA